MSDISIQFELWKQCNNFCDFCYLAEENKFVSEEVKLNNLKKVNLVIDSYFAKNPDKLKAIGFLGGEFFQGQMDTPLIKKEFYALCEKCFNLINNDKIEDFWCYCTLTIGNQEDLYSLIELFDKIVIDKKHHFWIQTSYDTQGRFNNQKKFENWNKYMLDLQKYSFVRFNVTSIMTESFLQEVLSGKLDLNEFQKKYKNHFFLKQGSLIGNMSKEEIIKKYPWFFPKRKTYLDFLHKIKKENYILFDELLNISLRSDFNYGSLETQKMDNITPFIRNKETWEETGMEVLKCGHMASYQYYADSDACCLCDYLKIKDKEDL